MARVTGGMTQIARNRILLGEAILKEGVQSVQLAHFFPRLKCGRFRGCFICLDTSHCRRCPLNSFLHILLKRDIFRSDFVHGPSLDDSRPVFEGSLDRLAMIQFTHSCTY